MAGAYSGFCSMKQMKVLLLPPRWDVSPSQDTQHKVMRSITVMLYYFSLDVMLVHCTVTPSSMSPVPILYTWVKRDTLTIHAHYFNIS